MGLTDFSKQSPAWCYKETVHAAVIYIKADCQKNAGSSYWCVYFVMGAAGLGKHGKHNTTLPLLPKLNC